LTSSHSGFSQAPFFDGQAVRRKGCTEIRFTLRPQKPLVGRLLDADGKGLVNQRLAAHFEIAVHIKNGTLREHRPVAATTDANGRFEIADAPSDFSACRIEIAGSPRLERIMPPELLRQTPQNFVALHGLTTRPKRDLDINLGRMATLELQLLDANGGPSAGASVLLVSLASDGIDCTAIPWVATSAAGRLAMVVEPGKWLLFAHTDGAWAQRTLDIKRSQKVGMRLAPMSTVRGRVVDGKGKPVADAKLTTPSMTFHTLPIKDLGLTTLANEFNSAWIASTRTDVDGTFACYYLATDWATYKCVFVQPGKRKESAMFELEPDSEPQTIVIE